MKILDKIAYDVVEIGSLTARAKSNYKHEYILESAVIHKMMKKAYQAGFKNGKVSVVSHFSKMNDYDNGIRISQPK